MIALFNGRLHMTLLVPLIISEPGLAVEEIIPMCENKDARLRFMAYNGELVRLVFLVYLVCLVCLVRLKIDWEPAILGIHLIRGHPWTC